MIQKSCHKCAQLFTITPEDLAFYDQVSPVFGGKKQAVPPPTLCPDCRYQQRLTLRNERNLYVRKCDATGERIVSIFSPDKTYPPVYSQKYWWSDVWDAKTYARDFDFTRPFFEQWGDLYNTVPQIALNNSNSENCEFTNQSQNNKNCYLLTCCGDNQDCHYSMWAQGCLNSADCLYLSKSELCYEVVNGEKCYHCTFSQDLVNCSDCHFSINLIGCTDCVGCVNLQNKKFHIFNEPYSKEEYKKKVEELKLNTFEGIQSMREKMKTFVLQFPKKYYKGSKTENCSGDYIHEMKNSFNNFNCRYSEEISYCQDAWKIRNGRDLTENLENEFCYSLEGCGYNNNSLFSLKTIKTSDTLYSSHCFYSHHLFGCVNLRNSSYCIFNKQYSKKEYEEMVSKIIEYMQKTGEWGQHVPTQLSHFGYNESVAQEYFPLTKEQALKQGYRWSDYEPPAQKTNSILTSQNLPQTIAEVQESILSQAIQCEATGKLFTITPQELTLYRKINIPPPRLHYNERHKRRMNSRNPRHLYPRQCAKCQAPIETSYPTDNPETVYCEPCYLKEVY